MVRTLEKDLVKCVEIAVGTAVVGMQGVVAVVVGLIATL